MAEDEVTQPKQPTAAEAMFFYIIVKHMKTKADVDWEGVAQEHGFKNAEVAKVRFHNFLQLTLSHSTSRNTHTVYFIR